MCDKLKHSLTILLAVLLSGCTIAGNSKDAKLNIDCMSCNVQYQKNITNDFQDITIKGVK